MSKKQRLTKRWKEVKNYKSNISSLALFRYLSDLEKANYDDDAAIKASDDDRDWFLNNPDRNYRLRPAYHLEIPLAHGAPLVETILCVQFVPGARERIPLDGLPFDPGEKRLRGLARTVWIDRPGKRGESSWKTIEDYQKIMARSLKKMRGVCK